MIVDPIVKAGVLLALQNIPDPEVMYFSEICAVHSKKDGHAEGINSNSELPSLCYRQVWLSVSFHSSLFPPHHVAAQATKTRESSNYPI